MGEKSKILYAREFMLSHVSDHHWPNILNADATRLVEAYDHDSRPPSNYATRTPLSGNERTRSTHSADKGSSSPRPVKRQKVCRSRFFKDAGSCSFSNCRFSHDCASCGKNHDASSCPNWDQQKVDRKFSRR